MLMTTVLRPGSIRPTRRWLRGLLLLTCSTLLVLVLVLQGARSPRPDPALPAYDLWVQDEVPRAAVRVHRQQMLRIAVRPATAPAGAVYVHPFLRSEAGTQRFQVQPERTAGGAFLLQAPPAELPQLVPGRWEILFVVNRERGPAAALALGPGCADPGACQVLHANLEILP